MFLISTPHTLQCLMHHLCAPLWTTRRLKTARKSPPRKPKATGTFEMATWTFRFLPPSTNRTPCHPGINAGYVRSLGSFSCHVREKFKSRPALLRAKAVATNTAHALWNHRPQVLFSYHSPPVAVVVANKGWISFAAERASRTRPAKFRLATLLHSAARFLFYPERRRRGLAQLFLFSAFLKILRQGTPGRPRPPRWTHKGSNEAADQGGDAD
ncbi:hypothetical protein BDZ89DRAFT_1049036 [Hymenopellis radicata]|nr:hypothetical protein BDZ89DRAFT_1049036 [Hymenopellis radicata]